MEFLMPIPADAASAFAEDLDGKVSAAIDLLKQSVRDFDSGARRE
jgi:hypothetical protein